MKDARFFLEIRSFYYEIPLPLVIIKFTLNLHDLLQRCYKKRKNSKIEHVDQRIIDYLKKKKSYKFLKYYVTEKNLTIT